MPDASHMVKRIYIFLKPTQFYGMSSVLKWEDTFRWGLARFEFVPVDYRW